MPPGQYESITMHAEYVERLEEYRTEEESLGAAVGRLLDEVQGEAQDVPSAEDISIPSSVQGDVEVVPLPKDDTLERLERIEDLLQHVPDRTATELEDRLQR